MICTETRLSGCFILEPSLITDERGYFMESYNERQFQKAVGSPVKFVQDNQSFSKKGVLRGLHYQCGESAQAKLVRVISGEVLDVAVDIRPGSSTFGEYFSIILSAQNNRQLFVPRGFAHGFIVLSETAVFFYKCDNFYDREAEAGIKCDDPVLNIDWKMPSAKRIISEKDLKLPNFKSSRSIW